MKAAHTGLEHLSSMRVPKDVYDRVITRYKSAAIRRMVRFASENASDEELFAEEIATDRARDRGKEELEA